MGETTTIRHHEVFVKSPLGSSFVQTGKTQEDSKEPLCFLLGFSTGLCPVCLIYFLPMITGYMLGTISFRRTSVGMCSCMFWARAAESVRAPVDMTLTAIAKQI